MKPQQKKGNDDSDKTHYIKYYIMKFCDTRKVCDIEIFWLIHSTKDTSTVKYV